MIIKKLQLRNYRNYENLDIELSDKLNIFIGDNAQGKSNLLESIVVLALTKSYMNVKDRNLINDNFDFTNIKADVMIDNNLFKLSVGFDENTKKLKINNKEIKKYSDYISKVRFILFSPYEVGFVKGSPSFRRKYFNIEISQLSNKYVKLLQNYNVTLKKRNQLLKSGYKNDDASKFYLDVINDKISTLAVEITIERAEFVNKINDNLSSIFEEISGYSGLKLNYVSSIELDDDKIDMKKNFLSKLENNFEREKLYGMTLIGPHRDDYFLSLGDKDLSIYGSQGQNRLSVLALKLSEIFIFKNVTNDYPILLLDDVFSELDITKRNRLVKYILEDVQTIITTTDLEMIDQSLVEKSKIFEIVDGHIVDNTEKEGMKDE